MFSIVPWLLAWLLPLQYYFYSPQLVTVQVFHPNATQPETFPEFPHIKHKPNVGICFSGGGTRSYEASLGYLKGLHDAGLLTSIRYVSSVSGGSWATSVFSYHDRDTINIKELLGDYTAPERMDMIQLGKMSPVRSARYYPVKRNLMTEIVKELALKRTKLEDVWVKAVHRTFLEPAGITLRALPALSQQEIYKTLARNPGLLNDLEFRAMAGEEGMMPFPIINTAMLGPIEAAPFGIFTRKYTMMETSPMYVGFPLVQNVSYPTPEGTLTTLQLGGLVEPVGFGSLLEQSQEPLCGLSDCPDQLLRRIPLPQRPFSIANATAASSWAPGGMIAEQSLLRALENVLITAPYFSPYFGGGKTNDVFLGDGENIENQGVITLLRRNVKTICMFINSPIPISSRKQFNPYLRFPKATDVDTSFMNLFGYRTLIPPLGEDYLHVQVFRKRDFAKVMSALQDAYARGTGTVVEMDLEVVNNPWWGIKGNGRKVHMIFVYMTRVLKWEQSLSPHIADQIAPQRNNTNPKTLPAKGQFALFPHIPTPKLHVSAAVANALADMSTWVIKENVNLFTAAILGAGD